MCRESEVGPTWSILHAITDSTYLTAGTTRGLNKTCFLSTRLRRTDIISYVRSHGNSLYPLFFCFIYFSGCWGMVLCIRFYDWVLTCCHTWMNYWTLFYTYRFSFRTRGVAVAFSTHDFWGREKLGPTHGNGKRINEKVTENGGLF